MKVFFTAAYSGKEKYQKYYDIVRKCIEETGVELISPEKGNYKSLLTKTDLQKITADRALHYEAIKKGILWADLVIIEISEQNFQLGHEATLAIQNKKPVLCLSLHEDYSIKIIDRYFHAAKYNQHNAKRYVEDFINKYKKELLGERFNFFLSRGQLNFINEEAARLRLTSSEYIRRLIDKERST
ncbi:MAG: hypothetical protein JNK26_01530 [Candidatus Doudnabacteria bacterium]|nr:hypothetical protein [Candidatus Doudnabacteria bacterium]